MAIDWRLGLYIQTNPNQQNVIPLVSAARGKLATRMKSVHRMKFTQNVIKISEVKMDRDPPLK